MSIGFEGRGRNSWGITRIKSVGIQTGWVIDHIRINGTKHGGHGGGDRGTLNLTEDEYISEVEYRYGKSRSSDCGDSIIFLKFTTNKGRSISSVYDGTEGTYGKLEKIKLLGIGGRSDDYVRKLDFEFIENYDPGLSVHHSGLEEETASISSPLKIALSDTLQRALSELLQTPVPEPLQTAVPDPLETDVPDTLQTAVPDPLETALPDPLQAAAPEPLQTTLSDTLRTAVPEPLQTDLPDTLQTAAPKPLQTTLSDTLQTALPDTLQTALPDTLQTALPDTLRTAVPDPLRTTVPEPLQTTLSDTLRTAVPEPLQTTLSDTLQTALPDPSVSFASHQGFILEYTPPFGNFQEYTSSFDKIAGSTKKLWHT